MGRPRKPARKGWPDNLHLNNAGYYSYRNPYTGKSHGIGRDKQHAMREARAANATLANMTPSSLVAWVTGITELSLKEWVPLYKTAWIENTNPAAATLRNQGGYLKRIEAASFSWMPLKAITTAHAAAWLEQIEEESGPSTVKLVRSRLSDVFRMAETKGMIEAGKNPVASTYIPEYKVKRERLSLEWFFQIRAKAKPWLVNAMNLALVTAQRREDVATMLFTDNREGYLFIVQGKTGLKLQQDVNIRLTAVGMSIADAIKLCRDHFVSKYMVHHGRSQGPSKPGEHLSLNSITNAFAEARDAAGYKSEEGRTPPSFHEIRSLSERLYKQEYNAAFAQAMLGHKNAKTTADYDDLRGSGWQIVAVK